MDQQYQDQLAELLKTAEEKKTLLFRQNSQRSERTGASSPKANGSQPVNLTTCPHCNEAIKPVKFMLGDVEKTYQPPVCPCVEAQAELEQTILKNEMAKWRSTALEFLHRSGLESPAYADKRFNNWDATRNNGDAGRVLEIVNQYVDQVSLKSENWALFNGVNGTGKTHLAVAALRKIAAQNLWSPHVVVWPELCTRTRESWGNKQMGGFESSAWDKARNSMVLLIDDLDKTNTDEKSMEKLFTVINTRYDRQLPTIITMNRNFSTLHSLWTKSNQPHLRDTGAAVLSRIAGQLMIEIDFKGKDQRWEG